MTNNKTIRPVIFLLGALVAALLMGTLLHLEAQARDNLHSALAPQDSHEPVLVKDINAATFGADPREIVVMGDVAYFVAAYRELWRSDGTPGGTTLVKDFLVGGPSDMDPSWAPRWMTAMNGILYFTAEDADHGRELWRSDGTEAGTTLVADLNPGDSGSHPQDLVVMNSLLYFLAYDPVNGPALWRSNGTGAGTWPVTSLPSMPLGGITVGDGTLFFVTPEYPVARLWRSDGSEAGTVVVKEFDADLGPLPAELTFVDDILFFAANNSSHGRELWRSDGTEPGTMMVKDIYPGPDSAEPKALVGMDGILYFAASDATAYNALWRSDGADAGTTMVHGGPLYSHDFPAGTIVAMNGMLYFDAYGGSGQALWHSDGTTAGTAPLVDLFPQDPYAAEYHHLTAADGVLYFAAEGDAEGPELWRSDGTVAGTMLAKDIRPGADGAAPERLTPAGSALYFSADDGYHGRELWRSDGTAAGTVLARDVMTLSHSSSARPLALAGGALFFSADDGVHGYELWRTDGTEPATRLIKDVVPGPQCNTFCPSPSAAAAGEIVYLTLSDLGHGTELWRSDGTEAGTWMVSDIYPGELSSIYSSALGSMLLIDDILFLAADDGQHGFELWRSDGTESGTWMVKDIDGGGRSSGPTYFVDLNGVLHLTAYTEQYGTELWRSDGTESGTWMLTDGSGSGAGHGVRGPLVPMNGAIYFVGFDEVHGGELWRSDGTAAGTYMVKDINPLYGGLGNNYDDFAVQGDRLFFYAQSQAFGDELWISDGTEAGTQLVRELDSLGGIDKMMSAGDFVYFTTFDSNSGAELWRSDGTEAGTVLVKDIYADGNSSLPESLTELDGLLYFTAEDGEHGRELWRTDGTEPGTEMVADIAPEGSSQPHALLAVGDTLYFAADDGVHGFELWRLGPSLPEVAVAEASIDGPTIGGTGSSYTVMASVLPLSATLPITFEWQATGQAPETHVVGSYDDSIAFTWDSLGAKEISLQVSNAAGSATATHSLLVVEGTVVHLLPGSASTLQVPEDGLTTVIEIPPGAVSEPAALVYRSLSDDTANGDLLFAGRAFELTLYRDGLLLPAFQFAEPLAMTVPYQQQDVAQIDEAALKLYLAQAAGWTDAAATCAPAAEQLVNTVANIVTLSACRSGQFALFGPPGARTLFLPVIYR